MIWCERAWLGGAEVADGVLVGVDDDGLVASVEAGVPCPPDARRLDGLVLPGLANVHSHAFHRALRGRTHGGAGSFWTWRERMYAAAEALDPDRYRALARAVFGEMLEAGWTCVGEFHYLHHGLDGKPYADANALGTALLVAAAEAGIRVTLLDACYLRGGLQADGWRPLEGVQRRFGDASVQAWAERVDALAPLQEATQRVGAAAHSVRALSEAELAAFAEATAGLVVHAHVAEQPAEQEACLAATGVTPTGLLARCGLLGESFVAVHATHLSGDDVGLLARSGAGVCLCPTTERDLADGIGPSGALAAAGVALCVGSDSHAVVDPFEEARAVELDERLATLRRGTHPPTELLAMLSRRGYAALGWPRGGQLAVGAPADLVAVALSSARLAGHDPAALPAAVLFSAAPADVHTVVVGGRVVVSGGRHVAIDVPAELDRTIRALYA